MIKLKKIKYHKLGLKDEIENISKFYRKAKNKNQKNKDWSKDPYKSEENSECFHGWHKFWGENKENNEKKRENDPDYKPCHYQQHAPPQKENDDATLPMTWRKVDFGCREAPNTLIAFSI